MPLEGYSVRTIAKFVGQPLGVTDWVVIEQMRIDQFADCTDDHQWIHVDVACAS